MVCLCLLPGCSDLAKVQGTVMKADGAPLIGARIIARSKSTGKAVDGATDANGHFQLKSEATGEKIEPGDYEVAVVENRGDMNMQPPTISLRYRRAGSSGLEFSVQPRESKELSWKLELK